VSREKIASVLSKYIPAQTVKQCSEWIVLKNIHLKITRGRASKFGDYRPLKNGKGHQITVNHDLNPYAFLITFVHEVAHLHTHTNYRFRHEPHGKEWKHEFRILLKDFIHGEVFPEDIKQALENYSRNPAASSCSDISLMRALKRYDTRPEEVFHLEDVPEHTVFSLHQSRSGLIFRKGHKIRTRFHCLEVKTKRIYFVSPMAEIVVHQQEG
jgi:SprT protein